MTLLQNEKVIISCFDINVKGVRGFKKIVLSCPVSNWSKDATYPVFFGFSCNFSKGFH